MMESHYPEPIAVLEKNDKELYELAKTVHDLALAPGELDARTKVLITMALDAAAGAEGGVRVLAAVARQMGVTEGQIKEVMRIVYLTAGMGALWTSKPAFDRPEES